MPLVGLQISHQTAVVRENDHLYLVLALAGAVPLTAFAVHLSRTLSGEHGFDMVGLYLILTETAPGRT